MTIICPDCKQEIPADSVSCPLCGCTSDKLSEVKAQVSTEKIFSSKEAAAASRKGIPKSIIIIDVLLIIALLAIMYFNSPSKMVQRSISDVCNSAGLTDTEVEMWENARYDNKAFYNVKITCDGFSSLGSEKMLDCFKHVCHSDNSVSGILFLDSYISINSDGHTYTYSASSSLDGTPDTIYCDGKAIYVGEIPEKREFSYYGDYDPDVNARHTDSDAFTIAKKIVKENLKSPNTAKFCSILQASVSNSGNSYTVTGWVDSENSFGATLRTNFIVTYSATKHGDEIGYKNASVIFE